MQKLYIIQYRYIIYIYFIKKKLIRIRNIQFINICEVKY